MATKKSVGAEPSEESLSSLMDALVISIVSFMSRAGLSASDIQLMFSKGLRNSAGRKRATASAARARFAYGCDTVAGAVLRAWHRQPEYLDEVAKPVPLGFTGPGSTLIELVKSQDPRADPHELIRSMHKARLVKRSRTGKFLPTKDAATIGSLEPMAVDHVAKTIMRLVETATGNMNESRRKPRLIERYAHVPDLDEAELRAFADFSKQQGQACLDSIEDWLEARQLGRRRRDQTSKKSVNAGVHIFAYAGDPSFNVSTSRENLAHASKVRATPA